ncbi:CoA ester lyase [Rhodococcus sp. ARC_M5]|uniref:HpcH/HpaI aldolase/citrate lyase family protein n=1 Tax=Rhodococcus sp. ARC_M5 TaxID=2928851 RepID=UPI001FB1C933|nr:CoA ester lyase [Rhodococcus sp. ARC_M5]MCJ0894920.1 CoA ester lyase [Rhodococcus sp. ARC_M5]
MNPTSARSFLYVPANKPELFDKAAGGAADAVIIDLEDAVPLPEKDRARAALTRWLASEPSTDTQIWIRVTPEFMMQDLEAVAEGGVTGIMVAKCSVESLTRADRLLTQHNLGEVELIGLIETAHSLRALPEMARCNRVRTFGIGEVDLLADLRITRSAATEPMIDAVRLNVVIDCAAAGLAAPIAPTSTDFRDLDGFVGTTERFVQMGFRARTALHPRQVPIINAALTPSVDDVDTARRLVQLYADSQGGPTVDDNGRFVDEAVVRGAREILGRA